MSACVRRVRTALQAVPGVERVEVDFEESEAHIYHQPGKTTVEELIAAVEGIGYRAWGPP